MSDKFRVSASALDKFFQCPAKYAFSRKLRPKDTKPWFVWGREAHQMMEGVELEDPEFISQRYYHKLKKLKEDRGYEIIDHEIEQVVDLTDEIELVRKIDALAVRNGEYVLVDWKTASSEWLEIQMEGYTIAPKGSGFQAAAYVWPAGDDALAEYGLDHWPEQIDFVAAFRDGNKVKDGGVFPYFRNQADEDNLIQAAEDLHSRARDGIIVKNRGFNCKYCDFLSVCYQAPGWEKEYERRGK